MSEHNEMGVTNNDEDIKEKLLSDIRRKKDLYNDKVRKEKHDEEVRKGERLLNTGRVVNLVSVLSVATAIAGFGYVAYGGDGERVALRGCKLVATGATLVAWLL